MCLSIAVERPNDVLAKGEHVGFEWVVTRNLMGFRCGYVRVPMGHPWHGRSTDDLTEVECHGGVTFADPDLPCDKDGPDDAFWIGFDCAHGMDLPDPDLMTPEYRAIQEMIYPRHPEQPIDSPFRSHIRTQKYVEAECRSICEQARSVAKKIEAGIAVDHLA